MKDKKKINNPYIDGKREWMERYGDLIKQKKTWQMLAMATTALSVITTLAALNFASKSCFIPYVVEVDRQGEIRNVTTPNDNFKPEEIHIKSELGSWIQEARSLTTDGMAQRLTVESVYSFINRNDPAFATLTEFSKSNWERSSKETVSVQILGTPLKVTNSTWQIEWSEITRNRMGEKTKEERWKGNIQIYFATPKLQSDLMKNPLGIYVKEINWTLQRTL